MFIVESLIFCISILYEFYMNFTWILYEFYMNFITFASKNYSLRISLRISSGLFQTYLKETSSTTFSIVINFWQSCHSSTCMFVSLILKISHVLNYQVFNVKMKLDLNLDLVFCRLQFDFTHSIQIILVVVNRSKLIGFLKRFWEKIF